jgi:hypothetical protein
MFDIINTGPKPNIEQITYGNITVKVGHDDSSYSFIKIAYYLNGDYIDDTYREKYYYDGRYFDFTFAKILFWEFPNGKRVYLNLPSSEFDGKPDTAYIEQRPSTFCIGEHIICSSGGYYGQVVFGNSSNEVMKLNWIGYDD